MKIRKTKKGFTIVELVIVIAVIGVLTAILVPTFISLTAKANKASDQSLVANLNTALKMQEAEDGAKNPTMHDAVLDLDAQGFNLAKLVTKSKEALLWNSETNQFELEKENMSGSKYWKIFDTAPAADYSQFSVYAKGEGNSFGSSVSVKGVGFDAGYVTSVTTVNYTGGDNANEVVIRTAGDQTVLTVNAPQDDINYYGFAKEINVVAVKGESLHIYGSTNKLSVTSGHVQVEDTGIVFELATNTGSVTNNGYIAEQTSGTAPTGTAVGGDYEIGSLARLEAFRDVVNSGKNFAGKPVKLTADITLKDGWKPIGEGNRDVAATNVSATGLTTYFAGKFDGQNHTISNLNNKGFIPTSNRIVNGDEKQYAYGLFALVGAGAEICNLKLENVDIDSSRYSGAKGDSVAALIGYSNGSLKVENVTVSGSIKASDAASGIIGRMYDTNGDGATVIIKDCTNKANITVTDQGGKAAGVLPIISNRAKNRATSLSITGCVNNGNITATNTTESYAAPIVAYETNKGGATYTVSGNTNSGTISAKVSTTDANAAAHI